MNYFIKLISGNVIFYFYLSSSRYKRVTILVLWAHPSVSRAYLLGGPRVRYVGSYNPSYSTEYSYLSWAAWHIELPNSKGVRFAQLTRQLWKQILKVFLKMIYFNLNIFNIFGNLIYSSLYLFLLKLWLWLTNLVVKYYISDGAQVNLLPLNSIFDGK